MGDLKGFVPWDLDILYAIISENWPNITLLPRELIKETEYYLIPGFERVAGRAVTETLVYSEGEWSLD